MIQSYQEAIRDISRVMVQVKNPARLIKIITRYLYREMGVRSSAFAVCDVKRARYIFYDSRGEKRVPTSLVKLDYDNPLVRWFKEKDRKKQSLRDYISLERIDDFLRLADGIEVNIAKRLSNIRGTMENLGSQLVFPGYYKQDLLGILFVGPKANGEPFNEEEILFLQILGSDASMALKTAEYQTELEQKVYDLEQSLAVIQTMHQKDKEKYLQTIITLANTVDAKDPYTHGHSEEVERWGMLTVDEMPVVFDQSRRELIKTALRLHDVGKVGVPEHILNKNGSLSDQEWLKMKDHVKIGAKILGEHDDFIDVAKIILHHHESYDGSGYPYGLKGEEIPLESRIIAVVDAFHAMISDRPYRKGLPYDVAREELERNIGRQFDKQAVEAFIRVLEKSIHL